MSLEEEPTSLESELQVSFKREHFASDIEAAEATFKLLMGSEAFNDDYHGHHVAMSFEDKKPVFRHESLGKLREMVDKSGRKDSLHIGFVGTEEEQEQSIPQELILTGAIE